MGSITSKPQPKAPSIPAPFKRPAIEIGDGSEAKRYWHDTPIDQIKPGDIIPDFGAVAEGKIYLKDGFDLEYQLQLVNIMGVKKYFTFRNIQFDQETLDQIPPTIFAFSK